MIRPQYATGALPRARLFMVAGLLIGGSLLDASKDVAASRPRPLVLSSAARDRAAQPANERTG